MSHHSRIPRARPQPGAGKPAYTSSIRLLGLPLFEYRGGALVDGRYRRGVARAWVAVGDIAVGVVVSVGRVAVGGVALGGLSLGVIGIGGLALGGLAWGGGAAGVWAVGGAAFGLHAALGGLAVAGAYAQGGAAMAPHANDPAAADFFASRLFFTLSPLVFRWEGALLGLPLVIDWAVRRRGRPAG